MNSTDDLQDGIDPLVFDCARSLDVYGDLAASEAMTRALVEERSGEREKLSSGSRF